MTDRPRPTSTYRLQLHDGFRFDDAAAILPYLARLGISHAYLSPVLQAVPGSTHGYDVVDHSLVSADLGGEPGLLRLAERAHEYGMGLVVDVVPNHMAIPVPEHLNRQLWDVLRLGRNSPTAHWFDVDWAFGEGRISLPILRDPLDSVLASGGFELVSLHEEEVLRYGDHVLPLAPDSLRDGVEETLAGQHYRLAGWPERARILNYRRFFDVDTLIAVRVELEDVFESTHATLLDLYWRGIVDGFRVDHPDGLADPQTYLERLRDRTDGAWVVAEKILEPGESLPSAWPCAGTTGYDAVRAIQQALVPPVAADLDARWAAPGGESSYERTELTSKRLVVADLFPAEVRWLSRSAVAAAAGSARALTTDDACRALAELLAHTEVYRAYLQPGRAVDPLARRRLTELAARASAARPDLAGPISAIRDLLDDTATDDAATRDLVVRFQQVCGPVMAKGVEDTTYYRWHRMVGLNEVGGDPRSLDLPDPQSLHRWAEDQHEHHPGGMTCLSTHDTKRDENVRARLLAAAENLAGWDEVVLVVGDAAAEHGVDPQTSYLLAQTLLGAWPIDEPRLVDYLLKAVREAKLHTTWGAPDEAYEQRIRELVATCLRGDAAESVDRVVAANESATRATTLATKLLQLTLPGVPDVYQGTEVASPRALVDPDNRRPVDYPRLVGLLASLDTLDLLEKDLVSEPLGAQRRSWALPRDLDAEKLWLTSRVLRLRRDRPELFDDSSSHRPIRCTSPHLLGFVRGSRLATVVTRWPGRLAGEGWGEASCDLPPGPWTDVLSGHRFVVGDSLVRGSDLLRDLPVALLLQERP